MNDVLPKKILIVDDDPGDILLLKKMIDSRYKLIEAQDGMNAVYIAATEKPDLVFLDVMMPKISGYTLCANLKSNPYTKDIPIVMITGLDTDINKYIGEGMGADDYLVKPAQPDQLLAIISKFLE
ncbi:MAG: response regulator [Dehalococcoidia bacterium]|nr:MAG: response regulator [Dehalococcoidia bacterium]